MELHGGVVAKRLIIPINLHIAAIIPDREEIGLSEVPLIGYGRVLIHLYLMDVDCAIIELITCLEMNLLLWLLQLHLDFLFLQIVITAHQL